jgi:hypothetical protein
MLFSKSWMICATVGVQGLLLDGVPGQFPVGVMLLTLAQLGGLGNHVSIP